MRTAREILLGLLGKVFTPDEASSVRDLGRLDERGLYQWEQIFLFDETLGGPGVHNIHRSGHSEIGQEGNYEYSDLDVFRPLQYCAVWFSMQAPGSRWVARSVVHMAGVHLEVLTKRLTALGKRPLGMLLKSKGAYLKTLVGPDVVSWLAAFAAVYNEAKHEMDHEKDMHRFDPSDAATAYFVARRLASSLLPHVT